MTRSALLMALSAALLGACTAPPGRSLGLRSVPNLRDLGGYTTTDGATVARGRLYRSNQLNPVSAADMQRIAALGLVRDYDLRQAGERRREPDQVPAGVEVVWLDVLADQPQSAGTNLVEMLKDPQRLNKALGGGRLDAAYEGLYRQLVELPSALQAYRQLFVALGKRENLPALFHCTSGKDRTGWAAAALLTLLGVPKQQVYADYLESNANISEAFREDIERFVARGGERGIADGLFGVKATYLDAAFEQMRERYGTIERYFSVGLGIDARGQQALRDALLER